MQEFSLQGLAAMEINDEVPEGDGEEGAPVIGGDGSPVFPYFFEEGLYQFFGVVWGGGLFSGDAVELVPVSFVQC